MIHRKPTATLINVAMGFLRVSRSRFKRMVAAGYVERTRNTPLLILVFIFYFFIGDQLLPTVTMEVTCVGSPLRCRPCYRCCWPHRADSRPFLWITITGLYFVLTFTGALAVERLELRLRRHRA